MITEPVYLPPKSSDPKYNAGAYWAVHCLEPAIADLLVKQMIAGQAPETCHNVWQYQEKWVVAGPCHQDPFPKMFKTQTPSGMTFRHKLVRELSYCDLEDLLEGLVQKYGLRIPFGAGTVSDQKPGGGIGGGPDVQADPLDKGNG